MNLERLRSLLPPELHPDLDRLWGDYRATGLPVDPSEFVAWLHVSGHLTALGLRDALSSVDVSVTLSETGPGEAMPPMMPEGPRHRYLGVLGKGAMGEVHIARDAALKRNVAIKKMIPRFARHRVGNARFQTEVQITAQLDHPSIVPVYTFEQGEDGLPAYSMKLVRGRTLTEYLAEVKKGYEARKPLDPDYGLPARLDVFLQICNAMSYAHTRGVIHRDLKPDNVMIGAFHEVIVMDWGIAKLIGGGELPVDPDLGEASAPSSHASVTTVGAAVGTPTYMSPEQAQGKNEELTSKSDQYALGLLLYELVALRRAYTGPTGPAVLVKAAHGQKEPISHVTGERIPRELVAIIDRATAYDPANRYADVEAFADDVRRYLRDEEVRAAPDSVRQKLSRWVSHHREVTLTIGFGLAMLIVIGAFGSLLAVERVSSAQRIAAQEREERVGAMLGVVSSRAHRIDNAFLGFQGQLEGLAQAATVMLSRPHDPVPYWIPDDIVNGRGPSDLAPAPYYHADRVSLEAVDVLVSPGVDPKAIEPRIWQLAALRPAMWTVMERSLPDHEKYGTTELLQRVRDTGVPVMWAYVATDEGVIVSVPGVWRYPPGYDVRTTDWYPEGMQHEGPYWFSAGLDESGMGLLATCTRRIHDADGKPIGLAALDVGMAQLTNLIKPQRLKVPVEAYLVDGDGQIIADTSLQVFQDEPKPFPYTDLLARVRAGETIGHIENYEPAGGKLVAWSTLEGMGWTYLVIGDADALIGG
jgi:serine/threonine protein kinase